MTWEQFGWYMGVVFVSLIVVGAILLLLHTQLVRSPSTPRLVRFLRHLSPLMWLVFPFAMILPIFYFFLASFFYGKPVDNLGASFVTSGVFALTFLYYYIFHMMAPLFSERPFGRYALNFTAGVALLLGGINIFLYNSYILLLLLVLCALSCWLAMQCYEFAGRVIAPNTQEK
jgi:hypothetical protein